MIEPQPAVPLPPRSFAGHFVRATWAVAALLLASSCVVLSTGHKPVSAMELEGSPAEAREFLRVVVQWERCELIETPDGLVARHTSLLGLGHDDVTVRLEPSHEGTVMVLFESADQWDLVDDLADRCRQGQQLVRAGKPLPDRAPVLMRELAD